MTDNEIIKTLEYCCKNGYCKNCSHNCLTNGNIEDLTLGLINRQKAEIERLRAECGNQSTLWSEHYESIFETAKETAKTEAIKEFAERLKEKAYPDDSICTQMVGAVEDIDSLVKEMVCDNEMNPLKELADYISRLWVEILLFVTCPLWGVPYFIYHRIKNRKG